MGKYKQPDFQEIFFDHFEGNSEPILYQVRRDSNFLHDVAFMSSLIHDSVVKNKEWNEGSGQLEFDIDRDRWEFYRRDDALNSIHSKLTFTGVERFEDDDVFAIFLKLKNPMITLLRPEHTNDIWAFAVRLFIDNHQPLVVHLKEEDSSLTLRDIL